MSKPATTLLIALGFVATFVGGAGLGYATTEPEIIEKTHTVTETVEVTPQACITALDASSQAMDIMADIMDTVPDAVVAAATGDVATLNEQTATIGSLNTDMASIREGMGDAPNECRAAAEGAGL